MIFERILLSDDSFMKKKKAGKKATKDKVKANLKPQESISPIPEDELDFGGLPQRDIKKNLGCG
jgi:hypothetical protein